MEFPSVVYFVVIFVVISHMLFNRGVEHRLSNADQPKHQLIGKFKFSSFIEVQLAVEIERCLLIFVDILLFHVSISLKSKWIV
ncbi:hypothetical protein NPIL_531951 [Nephila pilipes]|uniref:Uncharacterized protein n=1 Tax=Nephila pilipes TaxID=299642 RepID=A0A8X6PMD8_NEPPI|nr:hypothetical protein NPIL_531951 [Nephila pilipes]